MNTFELVMTLVGVTLNTTIFFYILCQGFYWKPSRAVFLAPFGTIALPIMILVAGFLLIGHGLTFLGNRGINLIEKALKV